MPINLARLKTKGKRADQEGDSEKTHGESRAEGKALLAAEPKDEIDRLAQRRDWSGAERDERRQRKFTGPPPK